MRLVVARCSVDYRGRLEAHLPPATRLIMVKADGCVAVHSDGGAYKPLNWMPAPNTLAEEVEPQARVVAESRGIAWSELDYDELRGLDPAQPRLF